MDQSAFEQSCAQQGFEAVEERQGTPGFTSQMHSHPFTARIMVTGGEFTITRNGAAEVYTAGGNFTMDAGCEHAESFGVDGATFLAARKHHPAGASA
ncbi:MAG: quercetin dioxygenase-like cupin family protein [Gammaproteobacteria bacterium]|jgi:quercetin dioxygenase-like cupin family protein